VVYWTGLYRYRKACKEYSIADREGVWMAVSVGRGGVPTEKAWRNVKSSPIASLYRVSRQ